MSAGVYTYTVNGTAPCPDESATVTVTINTPPDPGTDGTITLCSSRCGRLHSSRSSAERPMPVARGAVPVRWSVASFDPASMSAGVYTYTVNGTAPCPALTAAQSLVIVNPMPDAGIDGGLTLCSSSPTTNLVAGLNGTSGCGWHLDQPRMADHRTAHSRRQQHCRSLHLHGERSSHPAPVYATEVVVNVVTNPDAGTPGARRFVLRTLRCFSSLNSAAHRMRAARGADRAQWSAGCSIPPP